VSVQRFTIPPSIHGFFFTPDSFILRVLRNLPNTRRKLNGVVFRNLAQSIYPAGADREAAIALMPAVEKDATELPDVPKKQVASKAPIAEVDAYFYLLLLVKLIDASDLKDMILLGFRFLWHKEVFDFAHIVAEQTKGSSYWVPIIFAGFVAAG